MKKIYLRKAKRLGIIVVLLIFNTTVFAANRFWVATTPTIWNSTANWSVSSGGPGGASIPGNTDIAIFDNAANGDCNINGNINIQGLQINGYLGTIVQAGNNITIGNGGFSQNSGTFTGGTRDITINGATFNLSGGTFTSTQVNLSIGGSQPGTTIFTHTAGTFNNNNGAVIFNPTGSTCGTHTYEVDVIPATVFYSITVNAPQYCGYNAVVTSSTGDVLVAQNNFTHTDGVFNGEVNFQGNLIISSGADGGLGILRANGTGAQTYSVVSSAPRTAQLIIDKTSGTFTPAMGTTDLSVTRFSLLQGDFTAPSGSFKIGASQPGSTIFTHTSGTFNNNNGTVVFDPTGSTCGTHTYEVDVIPATVFYSITVNAPQYCGYNAVVTSSTGDVLVAQNDFTHTNGVFNGEVNFQGNLIISSGADGGLGILRANGTGAQTYSVVSSAPRTAQLIIDKTSGTFTPAMGTTNLKVTKFSLLQGSFTAPSGNFNVGGSQGTSTIFTHTSGTYNHNNGTLIVDPTGSSCTTHTFTLNVIPSTAFFNVKINAPQYCGYNAVVTTAVGDTIDATNDFTHTDGVFNGIAQFKRDLYVDASANGGSGKIIADGTSAQTYNIALSAPRTVHLVVNKTANTLSPGSGTTELYLTKFSLLQGSFIAPSGDFNIGGSQGASIIFTHTSGTFNHNSGTVVFAPSGSTCTPTTFMVDVIPATWFNYVRINGLNYCGYYATLTTAAGDTIKAIADLIHNDGLFNGLASTQNNLIVNAGSDGGTGSFIFNGPANQTYWVDAAAPRSPNIVVYKGAGNVSANATTNWSIRGLNITQGNFEAPSGDLNLFTSFSNSGVFTHNNANVTFNGTSIQPISGSTITTFYNIKVNNNANVGLAQNAIIDNNLEFINGRFVLNSRRLFLGLNTTITGVTASRYIQGNGLASGLGVQKEFAAGTANFTFPVGTASRYTPVNYDITANSSPGTINIQPVNGKHPNTTLVPNTQLNFYWKVLETGFSGLTVTHTYNYIQADVTGSEAAYVAGRFLTPLWTPLGGIPGTVNTSANTITLTGVNYLVGDYTAGAGGEFQNTPSVVITASPLGTICSGTNVTFTAVPTNGGTTPSYQWQVNGVNVGTNSTTYSSNALVDDDVVTCILTSSLGGAYPNPVVSNPITMSVTPSVTPSISISALPGSNVCLGTPITFNASIANGGASPSYQWKKNGVNVGTNSPSYTLATPANGDVIKCILTSNAACRTANTASSADVTITVNPTSAPTVSITANPPGGICDGTSVTFNASITNGGLFPTYQWKLNGVNVGTNSSSYTNTSLINGDDIICVLTSSEACALPTVVNSNLITMTVGTLLTPAVSINASPSASICSGTTVTFTPTPVNGGGSPTYEWFINGISQGISNTLVSSTLSNADVIHTVMTSSLACASPTTATSNSISMTVTPVVTPSISISSSQTNICTLGMQFNSSITNGGATPGYQWKRNGNDISGANSATYSGNNLLDGDIITCVLTSSASCPIPASVTSNSITVNFTGPVSTWLGVTSDWSASSPGNWDNGIPDNETTAIIPSGTPNDPQINGAVSCFNIEIQNGATLTVNSGNTLSVYGKFTNNGDFNAGVGKVEFLDCAGITAQAHQITSTNSVTTEFYNLELNSSVGLNLNYHAQLLNTLTLTNGVFTNNAQSFIFKSNSTSTAHIAPVSGGANYIGNITMERYAPGGSTGWALIGTNIQGATLSHWIDDFPMTGFTGAYQGPSMGGFVSVYTYDETPAGDMDAAGSYVAATNITNPTTVGQGFWVYLGAYGAGGANTTTTPDITFNVTGQPTIGNFNFNPSFTNSANSGDGFNLIANPYPSAIDWLSGSWTKTNIDDAIYMYQADNGQYATFINGIGTNGATRYIASSQGFYVHANAASPALTISENAKSSTNPTFFKEFDPNNVLRLKVSGLADSLNDETVIYLSESASKQFDGTHDAFKMFSNDPGNPSISSICNSKDLSINGLPFSGSSQSIPVRVTVGSNGMYQISWKGLNKFEAGTCLVLEDLKTGEQTIMTEGSVYYFTATVGFKDPRFVIHITSPLKRYISNASCSNNNDGAILLINPDNQTRKVQLLSDQGRIIEDVEISQNYSFSHLKSGSYLLRFSNSGICGDLTQAVNIEAQTTIDAKFELASDKVSINEPIQLQALSYKNENLIWDLGDGTIVENLAHVSYQYKQAGTYTVSLTKQKENCSETESRLLFVSEATANSGSSYMDIQTRNGVYFAVFNFAENTKASIQIVNALGQMVATMQEFEGKSGTVKLNLDNMAEGVYIITLRSNNEMVTKRIIK